MTRFRHGNRFLGGGPKDKNDLLFKLFLLSIASMILAFCWILWNGQGRETWLVVSGTVPFYVITPLIVLGGIFLWYKIEEFSGGELAVFIGIAVPCAYVTLAVVFLQFTSLGQTEVWNAEVKEVQWAEAHYTDGGEDSSDNYHAAVRTIITTAGESIECTASVWRTYVKRFGGQRRVTSSLILFAKSEAFGTDSNNNGVAETHTITWNGEEDTRVATSYGHITANYVVAAHTSLKKEGVKAGYLELLVEYPPVTVGELGPIYFDHVIEHETSVGGDWHKSVNRQLDDALRTLGADKECNILVYVVGTENVGFFQALREHWQEGKKNDICICIGYTKGKIHWCQVMTYTDHALFVENLERDVRHLKTLEGKGDEFVKVVLNNINAPDDAGFLRKPMSDFEFLAAEVPMAWWIQLLSFFSTVIWLLPTFGQCVRD